MVLKAQSKRFGSTRDQILALIYPLLYLLSLTNIPVRTLISFLSIIQYLSLAFLGPQNPGWDGIDPSWVPIVPSIARWENKTGQPLSRTQMPLTAAWAITIHKSQGLTLERAVVDLGEKDFSPGLSFVAISWLKSLKGLAFHLRFEHTRLQRKEESANMKMLRDDNEQQSRLGFQLNTYDVDIDSLYNFLT